MDSEFALLESSDDEYCPPESSGDFHKIHHGITVNKNWAAKSMLGDFLDVTHVEPAQAQPVEPVRDSQAS